MAKAILQDPACGIEGHFAWTVVGKRFLWWHYGWRVRCLRCLLIERGGLDG